MIVKLFNSEIRSFASEGLINIAKEVKSAIKLPTQVKLEGTEDGLFIFEDTVSVIFTQKMNPQPKSPKYANPSLDSEYDNTLKSELMELASKVVPSNIKYNVSNYLEKVNNNWYIVRSLNLK